VVIDCKFVNMPSTLSFEQYRERAIRAQLPNRFQVAEVNTACAVYNYAGRGMRCSDSLKTPTKRRSSN
jgi:hypothetical protein